MLLVALVDLFVVSRIVILIIHLFVCIHVNDCILLCDERNLPHTQQNRWRSRPVWRGLRGKT